MNKTEIHVGDHLAQGSGYAVDHYRLVEVEVLEVDATSEPRGSWQKRTTGTRIRFVDNGFTRIVNNRSLRMPWAEYLAEKAEYDARVEENAEKARLHEAQRQKEESEIREALRRVGSDAVISAPGNHEALLALARAVNA